MAKIRAISSLIVGILLLIASTIEVLFAHRAFWVYVLLSIGFGNLIVFILINKMEDTK